MESFERIGFKFNLPEEPCPPKPRVILIVPRDETGVFCLKQKWVNPELLKVMVSFCFILDSFISTVLPLESFRKKVSDQAEGEVGPVMVMRPVIEGVRV